MFKFNRLVCASAVCTCVVAQGSHEVIVDQTGNTECVTSTFEGGGQAAEIHPEIGFLIPGSGMRFPGWLTITSGNFANNPSGITTAFWDLLTPLPENSREMTFDDPVASVNFFYAYQATAGFPTIITLEAFDAAGNLVATASAPGNVVMNIFNVWDPLGVDVGQNMITKVRITGRRLNTVIDDFTACRIVVITATIDIKPADDVNEVDLENPINLNSRGELPVAILTSLNFDALTVDETTVEFGDPQLVARGIVNRSAIEDVDGDGSLDLLLFFSVQDLVDCAALDSNSTQGILTGSTINGTSFEGVDSVRIVGRK